MMVADRITPRCGNRRAHKGHEAHHETSAQVRLCFAGRQVASIEEAEAVTAEVARLEAEGADCEHGLSASLCEGPDHYPADDPNSPFEHMTTAELMSATSNDYHRRGEGCPWDCSRCPGNIAADEAERAEYMRQEAETVVPEPDTASVMAALAAAGGTFETPERQGSPAGHGQSEGLPEPSGPASPGLLYDGIYTLEGEDGHRTFRVRTQDDDAEFAPGKTVIGYLSGPDNERDYTGFGFVFDGPLTSRVAVWKKHRDNTELVAAAEKLAANPEAALKEAKCRRCHRRLTVPASVHNGYGPECIKKVGL